MPSVPARAEIGLSLCAWAIGGASFARGLEGLGGATYYTHVVHVVIEWPLSSINLKLYRKLSKTKERSK